MNRYPRYRAFGTFRLILAVMVVAQHVVWIAPPGLSEILRRAATGNIAVLTFFALSGFIMAEAADQFYGGRPWAFSATITRSLAMERITEPAFAARRDALPGNAMSALVNGLSTGSDARGRVSNSRSGMCLGSHDHAPSACMSPTGTESPAVEASADPWTRATT